MREALEDISPVLGDVVNEQEVEGVVWLEPSRVRLAKRAQIGEDLGASGVADASDPVQRLDQFARFFLPGALADMGIERANGGAAKRAEVVVLELRELASVAAARERLRERALVFGVSF